MRQRANLAARTIIGWCLILGWLLIVCSRTIVPVGDYDVSGTFRTPVAWWPGESILAVLRHSPDPTWQLLGNLLMLAPLGFLSGYFLRSSLLRVVMFSLLFSITIEAIQWWAVPVRVAAFDDVLLNVAGASVGLWAAHRIRRFEARRAPSARAVAGSPQGNESPTTPHGQPMS